jgi:twitching motility two-component system response regulator PilH
VATKLSSRANRAPRPDPDGRGHAGTNGYQATRTIVRDEATRDIPVIICTSKGLETDKIWGMRQGAFDYMVKPLDHAVLLEKIRALS